MILELSATYKATIRLSALQSFASNAMVADKLTQHGFTNVNVTGSGKERTATGTWSKPTTKEGKTPAEVIAIEKI